MTIVSINRMTDVQLQIAIKAKAMRINGIQNILAEHNLLPKEQISELWGSLQSEMKLLEGLQLRAEESAK